MKLKVFPVCSDTGRIGLSHVTSPSKIVRLSPVHVLIVVWCESISEEVMPIVSSIEAQPTARQGKFQLTVVNGSSPQLALAMLTKIDNTFNLLWVFHEPSQVLQVLSGHAILPFTECQTIDMDHQYVRITVNLLDPLSAKSMICVVFASASTFLADSLLNKRADAAGSLRSISFIADREL